MPQTHPCNPPTPEPEWAAFLAIDWGDKKHTWKLGPADHPQDSECGEVLSSPEAIDQWANQLAQRFHYQPIAVALEQSRGPLVYQLSKYPFFHLYPIHPATSASYRQTFSPSGTKSDPRDTASLFDLLLHHRDRLRRLEPDSAATRELRLLTEDRRSFVDERTRLSNSLTATLKSYFPQVLAWIDNIDGPMGCALLARWPSLQQLQRTKPNTLHDFFVSHHSRSESRIEQRIAAIYDAVPATFDEAILRAGILKVLGLVALLEALNKLIAQYDEKIRQATALHPETHLFANLPGAGPALLPRLVAAFGTLRQRYSSAAELASYSGIAPIIHQSGQSFVVQFRRACPKFLRQTFHEFALHSVPYCSWAHAYYTQQLAKNKRPHASIRALAFKWIRILFRCWQDRVPYNEDLYLSRRNARALQLKDSLPPATRTRWHKVAGFDKFTLESA